MEISYEIVPLTKEYLESAMSLVHRAFPREAKEKPSPANAFEISLDPHNILYEEFWKNDVCDWMEYYVAIEKKTQNVVGTSGLYHQKEDGVDIVYLGWYSVEESFQGKGIGKALLQFTIDMARKQGKKLLRLYTNEEENKTAQFVYEKLGFKTYKTDQRDGWLATYKELIL